MHHHHHHHHHGYGGAMSFGSLAASLSRSLGKSWSREGLLEYVTVSLFHLLLLSLILSLSLSLSLSIYSDSAGMDSLLSILPSGILKFVSE
jgi:hypothetical protein